MLTASWKPNSTTCNWLMAVLSKSSSSLSWERVLAMIFLSAMRTKSPRLTTRVETCWCFSLVTSEPCDQRDEPARGWERGRAKEERGSKQYYYYFTCYISFDDSLGLNGKWLTGEVSVTCERASMRLATTLSLSSVRMRCRVALLSLSFLSMKNPESFSSGEGGALWSSKFSTGMLGRRALV